MHLLGAVAFYCPVFTLEILMKDARNKITELSYSKFTHKPASTDAKKAITSLKVKSSGIDLPALHKNKPMLQAKKFIK